MKELELIDDGHCFACGKKNDFGLGLEFRHAGGKTISEFIPRKVHQGFKDIVHGGIITTVLDEAMVKRVLSEGMEAVTAEISVRFRNPLFVGEKAVIEAEIKKAGSRLLETSARMTKGDGTVVAEAEAKLLRNV
jgi:acyl-coenzyme A thioesterase PaaI-like protein